MFWTGFCQSLFGSWIGDFVGDFSESTGRDSTLMTVKNLLIFDVEWFVGYIVDAMGYLVGGEQFFDMIFDHFWEFACGFCRGVKKFSRNFSLF